MNNISKLIDKYKKLVVEVYNEEDLVKQNKIDVKIDKIINEVYEEHLEKEFFKTLFDSSEAPIVAHISDVSFCKNYDLKTSLEKMKWLKNNANELQFVEDLQKNKKWQSFYANKSITEIEDRVAFYNKINDEVLFNNFFTFQQLCDDLFQIYISKKNLSSKKQELLLSIEDLKKVSKEKKFFDICIEKFKETKTPLYIILTYYVMGKFDYKKKEAIYALKTIDETRMNLPMLKLRNELLFEIG